MRNLFHLFSFLTLIEGAKVENSSITKVIDLLKDMKSQVEEETKRGAEQAAATEDQCIKDITQLEGDVKYTSEKAEESAGRKEGAAGKATKYAGEAEALGPQIAAGETAKVEAKKAHDAEAAKFNKEEQELAEAVTMLTQAYSVLKRSLAGPPEEAAPAFLQLGVSDTTGSELTKVVNALSSVVNAAWVDVTSADTKALRSFVQESGANNGDLSLANALALSQQPQQAKAANYQSKSGGILDAIEGMQSKAEEELTALKEKALKARHAYELLTQDLTSKIELQTEQMDAAKTNAAEATANSKKAAAEQASAEESLDAFKTQLVDTKAGCDKAAADWAARSAEAGDEIEAIASAVDILVGKFAKGGEAFLQVTKKGFSESQMEARDKAAGLLRKLGEKYENFSLIQAASSTEAGDPFVKVRKMIQEMIVKLEDEQAKEAAKEAKCKADKAKGAKDVKVKSSQLKKLQARADKAAAKVSELAVDLQELGEAIKLLETSKSNWTKARNSSRQENQATITEAKESVEALNQAITVLQDFYGQKGGAAFLQTAKLSDKADAIIGILQTAQTDFEKMRQTTEKSEKDAQDAYEKDMQDADVSLSKNNALVEGKTSEQAAVKVQQEQIDEDLGNAEKAWEAATNFLKSVNEACANKPMTFEEKQAKRKSEIEGLQQALEILSGDAESE